MSDHSIHLDRRGPQIGDTPAATPAATGRRIGRRHFVMLGAGGAAAAFGLRQVTAAPPTTGTPRGRAPSGVVEPTPADGVIRKALAVTDGWVSMPAGLAPIDPFFPDTLAAENADTYVFGFRDVTGLDRSQVAAQKGFAGICAPTLEVAVGQELWVTLTNLGLATRPDLQDAHTMHWHGFRNAIPFYDGVPETSISVPVGRDFTYVFRPQDAGTYMYHCHFEDVEHVTMGMSGIVMVRPNADTKAKWAYDDPTTEFDKEYTLLLTEIEARGHWDDAHIQTTDWTDYSPNFWMMNGRSYPDTLAANGGRDVSGQLVSDDPRLQSQPLSSLIVAGPNERVLLRVANLGFQEQALTLPGVPMRIVGMDARPLGAANEKVVDTVVLGVGESRDILITAPATPGDYPLFNADMSKYPGTPNDQWVGGQRTHLHVSANAAGAQQSQPNDWKEAWL